MGINKKDELKNYINVFKNEAILRSGSTLSEWEEKREFLFNIIDKRMLSIYSEIWANRFDCSSLFDDEEMVKLETAILYLPWVEALLGYNEDEIVDALYKMQTNKEYLVYPPNVNQFAFILKNEKAKLDPAYKSFTPLQKRED